MLPNMPQIKGSTEERKLCKIYKQLNKNDQNTLLRFADFLANQESVTEEDAKKPLPLEPINIPRPDKESVIKAIRRLTTSYPMVDKENIFEKISALMTEHVMSGREASSVIDELEELFAQQYKEISNG